jgi:CubicO group peptidase (beta-lactamase class C family)
MRKKLKIVLLSVAGLVAAAVIAVGVWVLVSIDFRNRDDLDEEIAAKMARARVPGLAVAFLKDGDVGWTGYYGFANVEENRAVTGDTLFQMASVSKTITGTAVMLLVERGVIGLDDDVDAYLPFELNAPADPEAPIAFRHLLSHTAGIADAPIYNELYTISSGGGDSPISLEEFANGYFRPGGRWYDADANFTGSRPGEVMSYSNTAYGLIGYLVERITGRPFDDFCRDEIFAPLGMNATGWLLSDIDTATLATPYEAGEPLPFYGFPTYPDGTLRTTVSEYARFLVAFFEKSAGARVLSPETVGIMLQPQADEGRQRLTWSSDVLDSLMIDSRGERLIGHSGGDPGVVTLAAYNPARRTGLVVAMNGSQRISLRVFNQILLLRRLSEEAGVIPDEPG